MDISKELYSDEIHIGASPENFNSACMGLHRSLKSPVMMMFAEDDRAARGVFVIRCVFMDIKNRKWHFVNMDIDKDAPRFNSLAKDIYSASLFEREIKEMFGIEPAGNPDLRRLHLHDEVWPDGNYPLRKDFTFSEGDNARADYKFRKIEGEGVFEVPVGPVHAGIIGPGHFRFSVAGEPIINMETRLGFTHRGVEKLFEGKNAAEGLILAEHVSGDSVVAHSMAFSKAVEKIYGAAVPDHVLAQRVIFLELERMYNHAADIGGIAIDVGFSFPSMYASLIKESILALNHKISKSRYAKGFNRIGGTAFMLSEEDRASLKASLGKITKDLEELKKMLFSSVSFMDRVDSTGILKKKTAEDIGVVGLAARASGIVMDLRKDFPGIYGKVDFNLVKQVAGDVLARLNMRVEEFEESARIIEQMLLILEHCSRKKTADKIEVKGGCAIGYAEGWRGPVLYWVKLGPKGTIERCKIVDPSFHNWQALSFAVIGNIIPDFPLCNKSFDLSYSGNDL
jgi:Ni,Fe-hydrogenase III large subunit/Ni,Fe-hydrogenase III component G